MKVLGYYRKTSNNCIIMYVPDMKVISEYVTWMSWDQKRQKRFNSFGNILLSEYFLGNNEICFISKKNFEIYFRRRAFWGTCLTNFMVYDGQFKLNLKKFTPVILLGDV